VSLLKRKHHFDVDGYVDVPKKRFNLFEIHSLKVLEKEEIPKLEKTILMTTNTN
jgi:hypothetical protein